MGEYDGGTVFLFKILLYLCMQKYTVYLMDVIVNIFLCECKYFN